MSINFPLIRWILQTAMRKRKLCIIETIHYRSLEGQVVEVDDCSNEIVFMEYRGGLPTNKKLRIPFHEIQNAYEED